MRIAVVALLAGCAFHAHSPGGGDDDGGSGSSAAVIDDTAADFETGTLTDTAIDPRGTVEPAAFALAGFHARAYEGKHVSNTTTSWAQIETEVAAANLRGEAYEQLPANWGNAHPLNLGLSADTNPDDNFTVIYEGELSVQAGDHTIDIDGDDAGAIEIDPDGNGFQMFTVDATNGAKTIAFHLDQARWIPIHVAIGEGTGNSQLIVRLDGAAITSDITRARVTQDHGLLGWIYYSAGNAELVSGPVAVDSPNVNWGMAAPPYDLSGAVPTSYNARLLGQIHIAADGMYTLATTTGNVDDQTALYIDRHLVSRTSPFTDSHPTSATLELTAGWHAIMVEIDGTQKNIFGLVDPHDVTAMMTIGLGAQPPGPVTADMFRPAALSGYLSQAVSPSGIPLADVAANGGVTMIGLPAPQPAPPMGAVIESATDGVIYRNATPSDYTIALDQAGIPLSFPSTTALSFVAGDESAAGAPVPTAQDQWTYTITNVTPDNYPAPTVQVFSGFAMHGGPLMPFPQQAIYISRPHDLAGITALGKLTATGALDGATLILSVRTAGTASDLEAASWIDVANGEVPAAPVAEFVQYRLIFMQDGWHFPSVDKVELDYTR